MGTTLGAGGRWRLGIDWTFEPWPDTDPDAREVAGVELVPFVGDRCLLARCADGSIMRPGGTAEPDEHWILTVIRELTEETGGRLLSLHPFGLFRCHWRGERPDWVPGNHPFPDYLRVIAWCDAALLHPPSNPAGSEEVIEVLQVTVEDAARILDAQGQPEYAELYEMAASLRVRMTDETWFRDTTRLLEEAYLSAADPFGQSGKGGASASDWELSRRVVSRAVPRSGGTFLDACCANGLLMETVQSWCAEDGVAIEPYGLDLSIRLIELARRRLPHWADRFFQDNAMTWIPPRRFDAVYVLLDVVPDHRRRDLIDHLLGRVVADGGRLIVGQYLSRENVSEGWPAIGDVLRHLGYAVDGELEQDRGERGPIQVAWIAALTVVWG